MRFQSVAHASAKFQCTLALHSYFQLLNAQFPSALQAWDTLPEMMVYFPILIPGTGALHFSWQIPTASFQPYFGTVAGNSAYYTLSG